MLKRRDYTTRDETGANFRRGMGYFITVDALNPYNSSCIYSRFNESFLIPDPREAAERHEEAPGLSLEDFPLRLLGFPEG